MTRERQAGYTMVYRKCMCYMYICTSREINWQVDLCFFPVLRISAYILLLWDE